MKDLFPERLPAARVNRRAIKYFVPDTSVPDYILTEIMARTASLEQVFDTRHVEIIQVRDAELRAQIRAQGFEQPQFTEAGALLFICLRGQTATATESERDRAMLICAMISQAIMVTAASLGYDSCPMIGFRYDRVRPLIGCPDNWILSNAVVLGRRCKKPLPRGSKLPMEALVL